MLERKENKMSKSIIDAIAQPGVVVVFDVDGVLAPYEWGTNCRHSMPDDEWDSRLAAGEDLYKTIQPVKILQDFIAQKNPDEVYVCSKAANVEAKSKKEFCIREYGIKPKNICLVKKKSDKLMLLNTLRDTLGIPENRIAIVEDTVETLDMIAEKGDYKTIHVSSFL